MEDFKGSPGTLPNSVVSFMRKIVNKTANESQAATPATSTSMESLSMTTSTPHSSPASGSSKTYVGTSKTDPNVSRPLMNKLRQKVASHRNRVIASFKQDAHHAEGATARPPLRSQSSLTNDQLTAHLTDEERLILQKVFQKEEEFHRESMLKRTHKIKDSGSPLESPSATSTTSLIGLCRICRKTIKVGEPCHFCDTCSHPVCEDCSSYTKRDERKLWICSFCKRRGTQPVVALPELGLLVPTSMVQQRRSSMYGAKTAQVAHRSLACRKNSSSLDNGIVSKTSQGKLDKRRPSITESPRQGSLDVAIMRGEEQRAELVHKSRSRPNSPDKLGNSPRDKYPSSETLSERRSSSESPSLTAGSNAAFVQPRDSGFRSRDESLGKMSQFRRKSYSASDSSLEEILIDADKDDAEYLRRKKSRKLKASHPRKCLTAEASESDPNIFYPTDDEQPPVEVQKQNKHKNSLNLSLNYESPYLRHIASDAAIYPTPIDLRRQSDSQSSDFSDIRISSPPPDSLSPSSPDFSRSPRQSADSDTLEIPTFGQLINQRRSIPSVLVDSGMDQNHLTLMDCFGRRSSTGRALPKIPVEQSKSLLELPHSRTHSSHSLDLPSHEQPRRASAPEGENIRIVIDDVDSTGLGNKNSNIERVVLYRDENDKNMRTRGYGLCVMGGKMSESDNKLYAYVAWIVPGGPADKMSLKPGDKILEWDGKSLINCSYEQVCSIMDSSGKTVELLFEPFSPLNDSRKGSYVHQKRRLSAKSQKSSTETLVTLPQNPTSNTSLSPSRRKLPRTPQNVNNTSEGEILIQVFVEEEKKELVVTLICCKGPRQHKHASYAQVRILPELGFKCCKTELSPNMDWNETLIFQQFPVEKVSEMALEVGIWEEDSKEVRLIYESVIPLETAIEHQTDWWPLLASNYQKKLNHSSSMTLSTLQTNEDNQFCLNGSASVPSSRRNSGRNSSTSSTNGSPTLKRSLFSISASATKSIHGGHSTGVLSEQLSLDTITIPTESFNNLRRKSSSALQQATKLNRSFSVKSESKANVSNEAAAQNVSSSSDEGLTSDSDSKSVMSVTSFTNALGSKVVGEIKLGFVMTKGLLEIEVVCARGLPLNSSKHPPNTYVKTYLKEGNRHINKKKTRVIQASCDPQYKQTLKYDAAMIYGRSLLVMVWQKQKGFEHNIPLGAVEIQVNQLELHKLTIGWYKLYGGVFPSKFD